MSNVIYPAGSVYRSRDLWEELPREDCEPMFESCEPMFKAWLRAATALFVPLMFNAICWLVWELCR